VELVAKAEAEVRQVAYGGQAGSGAGSAVFDLVVAAVRTANLRHSMILA
jgi:hypothetical protein